eukprot:Hpha_TRINITY_DN4273_c0_g1::TRINITY_DN4273_c0_g1_i1::g.186662::m.186662
MGVNPFHHIFDAAFQPRCERTLEGHQGTGPYFELGCGHCLCSQCALLSAREECPLCGWQPHPAISAMFSRYSGGVRVVGQTHVCVAQQKQNDLFNAFGFYLGASLCVELACIFATKPLVFGGQGVLGAIRDAFEAIGTSVPDQFCDSIARSREETLRHLHFASAPASTDNPIPGVEQILSAAGALPLPRAVLLAKLATHLVVLLPSGERGEKEAFAYVFDPFGAGRDRLPYVAAFPSIHATLRHLSDRLRDGKAPDLMGSSTSELSITVVEAQPGATRRPTTSAMGSVLGANEVASAPPSCSFSARERLSLWHSASSVAEQRLWSRFEVSLEALVERQERERGGLQEWERCAKGTVRMGEKLRTSTVIGHSKPSPAVAAAAIPTPFPSLIGPEPADEASRRLDFSFGSFGSIGSPCGSPVAHRSFTGHTTVAASAAVVDRLLRTLPAADAEKLLSQEEPLRGGLASQESRARAALAEWERVKYVLARSRSARAFSP